MTMDEWLYIVLLNGSALSHWLAAGEARVSHVLSHVV